MYLNSINLQLLGWVRNNFTWLSSCNKDNFNFYFFLVPKLTSEFKKLGLNLSCNDFWFRSGHQAMCSFLNSNSSGHCWETVIK